MMKSPLTFPTERFKELPAHKEIASQSAKHLVSDIRVLGLYLLGSFADGKPDRYSDIDFYVVVEKGLRASVIADHIRTVIPQIGKVGTIFPATHLGDPHQIIVFYMSDLPVHVDYQYQELSDLVPRTKGRNALIVFDRSGDVSEWREACQEVADEPAEGKIDRIQYLEDRFWAWCWYTHAKIERGELWESRDSIEYIRTHVLVSLSSITAGFHDEGNRRLEEKASAELRPELEKTVPASHSRAGYRAALRASVSLYLRLFIALPSDLRAGVRLVDRDYFRGFLPSEETIQTVEGNEN